MQDCFKLLHFHLGSQIPNIRIVKGALNEAARIYAELVKEGAGLEYLDVGGGLGVDYDGSQTNFESSVNYTLEEYANDVVYHIQTVCDDAGVKHPTIVSESGRAIVAYHSVLIFNVLGVAGFGEEELPQNGTRRGPRAAARRPEGDVSEPDGAQRARELPRRAAGARHGAQPLQRRLSAARTAVPGRDVLLGDLQQAPQARPADGRGARGPAGPRRHAGRHVLLQFLAVPVDSGLVGDQAALPDDADPPAERGADAPGRARRHHLRLGRQDRSVHRSPRRQAHAGAAPVHRRARTTSACSSSAPTRRFSATSTTCSATRTPCT